MLTLDSSRARGHRRGAGPGLRRSCRNWRLGARECVCVCFFSLSSSKPQFSSLQNGEAMIFSFHFTTVPSARSLYFERTLVSLGIQVHSHCSPSSVF